MNVASHEIPSVFKIYGLITRTYFSCTPCSFTYGASTMNIMVLITFISCDYMARGKLPASFFWPFYFGAYHSGSGSYIRKQWHAFS